MVATAVSRTQAPAPVLRSPAAPPALAPLENQGGSAIDSVPVDATKKKKISECEVGILPVRTV